MMARWPRRVLVAGVAIGVLVLAGCTAAADPDVDDLQSALGGIAGVSAADVSVAHSNGPGQTQINVLLFVEDPSIDAVAAVVRQAAPVLSADPASSGREVSIVAIDGDPAELTTRSQALAAHAPVMKSVGEELGIDNRSTQWLTLSPADVEQLNGG
jgi:hypothetical protein